MFPCLPVNISLQITSPRHMSRSWLPREREPWDSASRQNSQREAGVQRSTAAVGLPTRCILPPAAANRSSTRGATRTARSPRPAAAVLPPWTRTRGCDGRRAWRCLPAYDALSADLSRYERGAAYCTRHAQPRAVLEECVAQRVATPRAAARRRWCRRPCRRWAPPPPPIRTAADALPGGPPSTGRRRAEVVDDARGGHRRLRADAYARAARRRGVARRSASTTTRSTGSRTTR